MNELVKGYSVDVQFPDVSGIEHHYMLFIRDEIAEIEDQLSDTDLRVLQEADTRLMRDAALFIPELSRFIDLAVEREKKKISPDRWWHYLDVIAIANQATLGRKSTTYSAPRYNSV